jgi:hypothetical protein
MRHCRQKKHKHRVPEERGIRGRSEMRVGARSASENNGARSCGDDVYIDPERDRQLSSYAVACEQQLKTREAVGGSLNSNLVSVHRPTKPAPICKRIVKLSVRY